MHRFFHTIVIVGAGITSGCSESDEHIRADADADASVSKDASQDSQMLADRVIEDAEVMREDASKDAETSDSCIADGSWNEDACPLIR